MGNRSGAEATSSSPPLRPAPPAHPLAARLAKEKRQRVETTCGRRAASYQRICSEARGGVPSAVSQQIDIDVSRTFAAMPGARGWFAWPEYAAAQRERQSASVTAAQAVLTRVLFGYEWRASAGRRSGWSSGAGHHTSEPGPAVEGRNRHEQNGAAYVQGINFMAAMCVGFSGGREEEGFWLLLHVMEDILGHEYLSSLPAPFLGYHADRAVAMELVMTEAPLMASALGQKLGEALSMLAARCFLSGFVGFLADEPLLALWESLFECRHRAYPRLPFIIWLVGLLVAAEDELVVIAGRVSSDEVCPLVFKKVQEVGKTLPATWRPRLAATCDGEVSELRVQELQSVAEEAWRAYLCSYNLRQQHEGHARAISDLLARTSTKVADMRSLCRGLPGAQHTI